MSFIINAELSDAVVAQGLPVYTAQQIGAVPLDPTTGKILSSYLPDQASLDLEVDQKIANNSVKFGAQWTDRHTNSTGNPYLVGSIVYYNGRIYRCIAENDSITPQQGGNPYWADLGVGYLLPNENPKIKGGSIDTRAGAVLQQTYETGDSENPTETETSLAGGAGGTITLKGGDGGFERVGGGIGGNSGSINLSGYKGNGSDGNAGHGGSILLAGGGDGADAGSINLSGGTFVGNGGSIISTGYNGTTLSNGGTLNMSATTHGRGGSINTSGGGGSIDTNAGYIELGYLNETTRLQRGLVQNNIVLTLPTATGTIALTNHAHGNINNDGRVLTPRLLSVLIAGSGYTAGNATVAGIPVIITITAGSGLASITANGNFDSVANGQYVVLQSGSSAAGVATLSGGASFEVGRPLITGSSGVVGLGSFGTAPNTFCQGNDVRLGAKTVFTLGGDEKITYALATSYVYGAHITRPSKVSGGFDQAGLYIQGNWKITGLVIMAYYPSTGTAGVTYGLVKINNASSVTNLWTAPSSSQLNNGLNTINNNLDVSLSDGDRIGFQLTIGSTAGATVPTNLNNTTILAHVYCVPR